MKHSNKLDLKTTFAVFTTTMTLAFLISCSGPRGKNGLNGNNGQNALCSTSNIEKSEEFPNGGVLFTCNDGTQSILTNGSQDNDDHDHNSDNECEDSDRDEKSKDCR
jgi:hypothetical protein